MRVWGYVLLIISGWCLFCEFGLTFFLENLGLGSFQNLG